MESSYYTCLTPSTNKEVFWTEESGTYFMVSSTVNNAMRLCK